MKRKKTNQNLREGLIEADEKIKKISFW